MPRCAFFGLAILLVSGIAGCSESAPETPAAVTPVAQPSPTEQTPAPPKPEEKPKPDLKAIWAEQVQAGRTLLEDGKFDELEAHFEKFASIYDGSDEKPDDEQQAAVDQLRTELAAKREEQMNATREEKLATARELVGQGKYEEATQAINDVQKLAPTAEQRTEAGNLTADIESRRSARRRLSTWMAYLATDNKKDVRTAQTQLHKEVDTALPLLMESVQSTENPILVANTLELLRRLQRPQVTLPAMLGVLKRETQSKNWDDAVREIGRAGSEGIGPELLKLTLSSENADQRRAALQALSLVPDPPAETFLTLLPQLYSDGPDLAAALQASAQAIRRHGQHDFIARRGIEMSLTAEQERQLAGFSARLATILESEKPESADARTAAKLLAVTIRQQAPKPLESVKVLSFGAQSDDGKAAAVLDGVWNKVDYPTMWRHPVDRRSTIILDLGEERTVEAVRLWNFNEPGGAHRGWKEVEIYVTALPTALTPVATGIVLPAPGAADTPDYSTTIAVPSTRGRYVTLQAKSLWRADTYTGLSEIQILGD